MNYLERHRQKLCDYITGVIDGTIVVSVYIRQAVERHLRDQQDERLQWRDDKVDNVLGFFGDLKININNKYRQFELSPWQVFILASIFGWYWKDTERRRYRYAMIYTARKQGKTMFNTCILLHMLTCEHIDAECYLLATTREQAGQALRYAKTVVTESNMLHSCINMQYQIRVERRDVGTCIMKTLAANADRLDSLNPTAAIIDEYHAHPTDDLVNVIKSGMARDNTLLIITTTAGFNKDYPCYDTLEMCKALLRREIDDDSYFAALYTLDDGDAWEDQSNWIKSNPNMGITQSLDKLQIDYNAAMNKPSEKRNFLTKNLNIYTETAAQWIDDAHYNSCMQAINYDELKSYECHMGIDLSSNRDLTSVALIFEHNGTFSAYVDFFCTEGTERNRKGGISLKRWIEAGHIIPTKGLVIDFDYIFHHIARLKTQFNIMSCGFDPWNNQLIIPRLESELAIQCDPFAQTTQKFNTPMKFIERLIVEKEINLPDNPVLRWNFRNAMLYQDGNGNIKIMKNKSADAVDGAVALTMALGQWIKYNFDSEKMALEYSK